MCHRQTKDNEMRNAEDFEKCQHCGKPLPARPKLTDFEKQRYIAQACAHSQHAQNLCYQVALLALPSTSCQPALGDTIYAGAEPPEK